MSHILAHCEGVPLHIEQMVHAFLESNLLFMASLALPNYALRATATATDPCFRPAPDKPPSP